MISFRVFPSRIVIFKNNVIKSHCSFSNAAVIKEEKIKIDKWNINYIKVGRGDHHVLCLPGILGTIWTDFRPQIEGFDKEKFTLVVWDPPGYGKSRPPDKEFTTNYQETEADHAFEFMKALEIPNYSILGWSDGGIIGMIHAAKYPEAVTKLVVFATNYKLLPEQQAYYNNLRNMNTSPNEIKEAMFQIYGSSLMDYWNKWVDCINEYYKKKNGDLCSNFLKDIKCPTFVLHGGKDVMIPTLHKMEIVKKISNSRLHIYPDGKHPLHLKYADDFNRRVQEFLLEQ